MRDDGLVQMHAAHHVYVQMHVAHHVYLQMHVAHHGLMQWHGMWVYAMWARCARRAYALAIA